MIELKFGRKTVDLPYTVRIPDVSEAQFDDLVNEDMKAELINGVMVVHSPTTIEHDDIGGFVRGLMDFYASARSLGLVLGPDTLVRLASGRKFCPDALFLKKGRLPRPRPKQLRLTPDGLVEVLSPSNRADDLEIKRPAYRQAGVGEVWFIDPEDQQVIVDRKRGRSYQEEVVSEGRLYFRPLTGFWLDVSWLWLDPLPDRWECLQEILGEP
jgi:Uma2 family endonuclease